MDEETINKALSPLMTEPDVRSVGWEYTGAT